MRRGKEKECEGVAPCKEQDTELGSGKLPEHCLLNNPVTLWLDLVTWPKLLQQSSENDVSPVVKSTNTEDFFFKFLWDFWQWEWGVFACLPTLGTLLLLLGRFIQPWCEVSCLVLVHFVIPYSVDSPRGLLFSGRRQRDHGSGEMGRTLGDWKEWREGEQWSGWIVWEENEKTRPQLSEHQFLAVEAVVSKDEKSRLQEALSIGSTHSEGLRHGPLLSIGSFPPVSSESVSSPSSSSSWCSGTCHHQQLGNTLISQSTTGKQVHTSVGSPRSNRSFTFRRLIHSLSDLFACVILLVFVLHFMKQRILVQ